MENNKSKKIYFIIGIILLFVFMIISSYNNLIDCEESVNNKWAQVETNYQRRIDLIPNLVNTVKGYVQHEDQILINITKLRSGYNNVTQPQDYQKLDEQLKSTLSIAVEAYPDLKANQNFLRLQDELTGTENRINIARRDYNNSVTKYNRKLRSFPTNILASICGFEKSQLFKSQEGAEQSVKINF